MPLVLLTKKNSEIYYFIRRREYLTIALQCAALSCFKPTASPTSSFFRYRSIRKAYIDEPENELWRINWDKKRPVDISRTCYEDIYVYLFRIYKRRIRGTAIDAEKSILSFCFQFIK